MSVPGREPNRLVQTLHLLAGAYGYNYYDDRNKARADDLLVRQKASGALGEAAQALTALETAYVRKFVPPATRGNPFPPDAVLQKQRELVRLREDIRDLSSRIGGLSVPTQDKVWQRVRDEKTLLDALLSYDHLLIEQADTVRLQALALTASEWDDAGGASLETALRTVEATLRERQQLLLAQT